MTEVLLINPSLMSPNPAYKSLAELGGIRPPLAILSLGSYLKNRGHSVRLIDANPHQLIGSQAYLDEVAEAVAERPVCVGLSVMTAQIPNAYLISQHIRKLTPRIPVIWGGVHPTLYPAQTSQDPNVDIAVHGPGEDTLLELVECLKMGKGSFGGIKNVAVNGRVNPARKPLDVNEIPFLDYDLIDVRLYLNHHNHFLFRKDVRMLPMITSRGCPYRCAFCINNTYRAAWRGQTPDRLIAELKSLVSKYQLDAVRFLDENFFTNKRRTLEILEKLRQAKTEVLWGTNTRANFFRADHLDTELVRELKGVGLTFASIGAESPSERILKFITKGITRDDIMNSARICHKAGITPVYSWMSGIPTQTREETVKTIDVIREIKRMCPSSIHYSLSIYRPFPGGELYELCKQDGLVEPKSLGEWLAKGNLDLTLGSIPVKNCSWIEDKDFVTFTANYTREITARLRENKRLVDFLYATVIKLRYRLGFFRWPNTEDRFASFIGRCLRRLREITKRTKESRSHAE